MAGELERLDLPTREERLKALAAVYRETEARGDLPAAGDEVNNHVHSYYSFSPYNPSQAAYMAWRAGLKAVGIMDHDSVAGAEEMVEAGKILGLGSTCGVELRVSAAGTAVEGRSLNNPGSPGIFYMAIHGIPRHQYDRVAAFLLPIHRARNERNRAMVEALNGMIATHGLSIDFDRDVYAASMAAEGGSVTERHILAALARAIMSSLGSGHPVLDFLRSGLGMEPPSKIQARLADPENPHYLYDLLGVLKSRYLPEFFIQPNDLECPPAGTVVAFARSIGTIPAYAYLGDIADSVTGDKKAEKFEDSYLEELFQVLADLGYAAVTYMPPRNSIGQLKRVMDLCRRHDLMEISGVDINSSRQSFSCPEVLLPEFSHLNRSTWALIAHERISSELPGTGLFGPECLADPGAPVEKRIEEYARLGQALDLRTNNVAELVGRNLAGKGAKR